MAPKVELKQKLEKAFRSTAFIKKLIDLTDKVLNKPDMMQHVNNLTVNPDLTDDFKAIKTDIATFGIDPLPHAEIHEPVPMVADGAEPLSRSEGSVNPSNELKAGRVMMIEVQSEYAKANLETQKKTTALDKALKGVKRMNAPMATQMPDIINAAEAKVTAQQEELSAATQYEARLAEVRSTLQRAVAKMEDAEIAAEAVVKAVGALGGELRNAETEEARGQLVDATNIARTALDKLKTERAEEVRAVAEAKAAAAPKARGGRNRRTKKTNYYRKRQRTTRNKSRLN